MDLQLTGKTAPVAVTNGAAIRADGGLVPTVA
jgi:hypothetical protein